MEQLIRLKTAIPGLDALLKGGLVAGSSYIVQGRPGAGKTILANQLAFNHVRQGGRALVATLLAESHERLFQYMSTMSFFDRASVGDEIQYLSAFDTLESEGLDAVVKLLRREIIRQKATVLIVDGLLNARSQAGSLLDTKKFIAELQGHAAFAGCTVLFLTSSKLDEGSPEHTMVDGVIELGEEAVDTQSIRCIHLRKTRGSSAFSGVHECAIGDSGFVVYPRIEALYGYPSRQQSSSLALRPSGSADLDAMIGGGLRDASVSLVMGPSGAGKTSLGVGFLAASTVEKPGLHFGFYETPERLKVKAKALGYDFQALEDQGALRIAWQPTTGGALDEMGARLIESVDRHKIKRVLIDSMSGMAACCHHPARLTAFFTALMAEMRARDVLVFATWESRNLYGPEIQAPGPDLSSIVDNILSMRFVDHEAELKRLLSILKVRDSEYDPSLVELIIKERGIGLRKGFKQAEHLLSGSPSSPSKP